MRPCVGNVPHTPAVACALCRTSLCTGGSGRLYTPFLWLHTGFAARVEMGKLNFPVAGLNHVPLALVWSLIRFSVPLGL